MADMTFLLGPLPSTEEEWTIGAAGLDALSRSINDQSGKIASGLNDVDFYSLRALWDTPYDYLHPALHELVETTSMGEVELARTIDKDWHTYLDRIHFNNDQFWQYPVADFGRFSTAFTLNLQICNDQQASSSSFNPFDQQSHNLLGLGSQFPSTIPPSVYDPSQDDDILQDVPCSSSHRPIYGTISEKIIRASFWSLLNNICLIEEKLSLQCAMVKLVYSVPSNNAGRDGGNSRYAYTAPVTGGVVKRWQNNDVMAVWKVGKLRRSTRRGNDDYEDDGSSYTSKSLLKEEAAIMAAWAADCPPSPREIHDQVTTRLIISQDRDELSLIFGTFDQDYVRWIRGQTPGTSQPRSFLRMRVFGPYHVQDRLHMEAFSNAAGGWLLQQTADNNTAAATT